MTEGHCAAGCELRRGIATLLLAAGLLTTGAEAAPAPAQTSWQLVYDRAQSAYAAGELAGAERAARDALAQARAGHGENRPFVASSLSLLALVRQRQGHADEAVALLREALGVAEHVAGGEANTAALALNLGQALEALGRGDEALAAYRRSLESAEGLGSDAPVRARALAALARLHAVRGETDAARRYDAQLLASRQPPPPAQRAEALLREAKLLQARGQPEAAVQRLREVLALEGRPVELEAISALAALYDRLGRADEAATLHRRALAILEQVDPQGDALAGHLNELALWHLGRKDFDQAQRLLARARTIVEARDPEGLATARIVANLAQVHEAQEDTEPAQALYRQALAIYERHGDAPEALLGQAQALNFLAGQDYRRRRFAQAEPQFLRALALTEQADGAQSPRLLPLLDNLVTLYRAEQRPSRAAPYAERAEALRKALPRGGPPIS